MQVCLAFELSSSENYNFLVSHAAAKNKKIRIMLTLLCCECQEDVH